MRILFTLITFSLFTISCVNKKEKNKVITYKVADGTNEVKVVVIDDCEYLFGAWGNATVLTHKGNCKNHEK